MLKTHNINLTIAGKKILSNINLEFNKPHFYSILGANGAGKSTLLKVLSGDIHTHLGAISINNIRLNQLSIKELATLRSVMPQNISLNFAFSVYEIIEMAIFDKIADDKEKYIKQALELFGVSHLKNSNYLYLSGGEKQRVQLARVISQIIVKKSNTMRYLFLDECTSSLDIAHQHLVFQVVKNIATEHNICVIVVLHDINLAAQYSDTIILMKQGKIIQNGSVATTINRENISKTYNFECDILTHPRKFPLVIAK